MNLPNKLTLLRVIMIPVFVILVSTRSLMAQIIASLVFIVACITDYLDGEIARRRNLITDFGKFADPIADKLLVMSALVVLVEQGRLPSWACIILLAREFVISGFRLVAVSNDRVIAAGKLGKYKTVFQMISVVMIILFVPIDGGVNYTLRVFAMIFLYASVALSVISGVDYIVRNKDCIKDM